MNELYGRCHELSTKAVEENPNLTLVRGWYHCPIWGQREHWWTKDKNGIIFDPTKEQFPSKGIGEYEEFNGHFSCEYCGKSVKEEDVYAVDHHVYCSYACYGGDIGF